MQKDKYLMTGASGFLGTAFLRKLNVNNEVVTIGRSESDLLFDITKKIDLPPNISFDYVIHLAGKAHIYPRSKKERLAFYNVNVTGTKNLLSAISKLDKLPKAFIFISTVSVYGCQSGSEISESHPLNGKEPYAESKILAEEIIHSWGNMNGIKTGILRLPLIAGNYPPGNLGAMIKAIRSGYYLNVGNTEIRKSIVLADDIPDIINKLLEIGGIYNLTDRHHPSLKQLEVAISNKLNTKCPITLNENMGKLLGFIGDFVPLLPINSKKIHQLTNTLTFSDDLAVKKLNWCPKSVLNEIPNLRF